MKKIVYKMFRILCLAVLLVGFPHISYSQSHSTSVEMLIEVAADDYQKGRFEQAVHGFSKVLLIEPYNQEALAFLQEMGLSHGIYAGKKTNIGRKIEQARQSPVFSHPQRHHHRKLINRRLSNQRMLMHNDQKEVIEWLDDHVDSVRRVMMYPIQFKRYKKPSIHQPHAKIHSRENNMSYRLNPVHQKQRHLVDQGYEVTSQQKFFEKDDWKNIDSDDDPSPATIYLTTPNDRYHEKVINVLQDYLTIREDQIQNIKDDIVYKELEILHTEKMLLAKLDELESYYESTELYEDILEGQDETIDEKNKDIDLLLEEVDDLRKDLRHSQMQADTLLLGF